MRAFVVETDTRAETRRESFVDELDTTAARIASSVTHRTLFHRCCRTEYTDDEVAAHVSVHRAAQKRAQHLPCHFEVVNSAATNRAMDFDAAWFAAQQSCGFMPY